MSAAKEENMSEDPAIIILESDGKKHLIFVRVLAEFMDLAEENHTMNCCLVVSSMCVCGRYGKCMCCSVLAKHTPCTN